MQYDKGKHCVFYHRYHLVWSTKYRYKVLVGDIRLLVAALFSVIARLAPPFLFERSCL
jgi:putative transposase